MRARLRTDLVAAMKARQPEVVSALRTTIAAIDNAEAVAIDHDTSVAAGEHVAGAQVGVGVTEAERRVLPTDEICDLIQAQIDERLAEATLYDARGVPDAADRLRREASALSTYTV